MKLLLDKNLSFRLCGMLETHGHDVVHVDDLDLGDADDDVILVRAREEERIVVSSDTDFSGLLAAERAASPSMILTRAIAKLPAREMAALCWRHSRWPATSCAKAPSSRSDRTRFACDSCP